ncbi:MAG: hypothetical protein N4A72_19285 [Bacteroidales bacterium]|jgi:hypothetical protein|nr:hypothetical protein [Bacteroidales bacterium]
MIFSDKEKQLILDFSIGKIEQDEFERRFPQNINSVFIENSFVEVIRKRDSDSLDYLFMMLSYIDKEPLYNLFKKLIVENWHNYHQDIARFFQFNFKNPDCIDSVIQAMYLHCEHWDEEDDRDPFVRKCAYVLATLGTDYAVEKLKELSKSKDPIIKKYCSYQLEKNNYFDR